MSPEEVIAYYKEHPQPNIPKTIWNMWMDAIYEAYCEYTKKSLE